MAKLIPLFDGGIYKIDEDDGRKRVLLTDVESQQVFYDTELHDTDNSLGTTLHMAKYADVLGGLEADDEILIGVTPDALILRGLWAMSFDAVEGFEVKVDLVSIRDVFTANATGVTTFKGTSSLDYNFANGLGDATEDAVSKASLWGGTVSDYRNEDALAVKMFTKPVPALLGQSTYIRLTVVKANGLSDSATCSSCAKTSLPTIQVGVIHDRLCVDKQQIRNYCNCGGNTADCCPEDKSAEITVG